MVLRVSARTEKSYMVVAFLGDNVGTAPTDHTVLVSTLETSIAYYEDRYRGSLWKFG